MTLSIAHIITGLDTGGAETMLYNLLYHFRESGAMRQAVYSLSDIGPVGQRIAALGIPVRALGMNANRPNPLAVLRLARWLQDGEYDVVQTWLVHADLVGGVAARLAGNIPTAWCIQNTRLDAGVESKRTLWLTGQAAWLSRILPRAVVVVAQAARDWHAGLGYDRTRMVIIPNGFDTTRFQPDPAARAEVRAALDIPAETPVVGMLARFEPVKDHANFIEAARRQHAQDRTVMYVLAGKDVTWENDTLSEWIGGGEFRRQFRLLGLRSDAARLFNAFDLVTLSSRSEALPLTIGEAMACGVPAVVTDVGDAAALVGDTGRVVPSQDADALAAAWGEVLALPAAERAALGQRARQRVQERYSMDIIAEQYRALWAGISASAEPPR